MTNFNTQSLSIDNIPEHTIKYQPRSTRALVVIDFGTPDGGVHISRDQHLRIVDAMTTYCRKSFNKIVGVRVDNYNGVIYWADAQYTEDQQA